MLENKLHSLVISWLISQRILKGFSQELLAAKLGKAQSFISKVERGERGLDIIEFVNIIKVLDSNPTDLFTRLMESDEI